MSFSKAKLKRFNDITGKFLWYALKVVSQLQKNESGVKIAVGIARNSRVKVIQ